MRYIRNVKLINKMYKPNHLTSRPPLLEERGEGGEADKQYSSPFLYVQLTFS
jgi:hypothetical protein